MKIKTKDNNKILLSITGLPRQGTTLISGIMNSFENSFCAIEPHWSKIQNRGQKMNAGDKVPADILYKNTEDLFIKKYNEYLESNNNFLVGCIKETYRHHQSKSCEYLFKSKLINHHLIVLRDPIYGFNSWRKTKWGYFYDDIENYKKSYLGLLKESSILKENYKKVSFIRYEDVTDRRIEGSPLKNSMSELDIYITDELKYINSIGSLYGDPTASRGGIINESSKDTSFLNNIEINILTEFKQKIEDILKNI